jgi:hypothetical protein
MNVRQLDLPRFVVAIPRAMSAESKTQESDSGKLRLQVYKGLVVQGLRILQGLSPSMRKTAES